MVEMQLVSPPPVLTNFDYLCPELIVEIFSYLGPKDLSQVALVCKRFKECAYSKKLWSNAIFSCPECIEKVVLHSLNERRIQKLSIVPANESHLQVALLALPNLQYLQLFLGLYHGLNNPLQVLKHVDLSALKTLKLTWFLESYHVDNRPNLGKFCQQFPNVENFHWDTNNYLSDWSWKVVDQVITNKELQIIFENMTKLKSLLLSCQRIESIPNINFKSVTLEHLTVENIAFDGNTLKVIGQMFPGLLSLQLVWCDCKGFDFQKEDLLNFINLQYLTFCHCSNFSKLDMDCITEMTEAVHIKFSHDMEAKWTTMA